MPHSIFHHRQKDDRILLSGILPEGVPIYKMGKYISIGLVLLFFLNKFYIAWHICKIILIELSRERVTESLARRELATIRIVLVLKLPLDSPYTRRTELFIPLIPRFIISINISL